MSSSKLPRGWRECVTLSPEAYRAWVCYGPFVKGVPRRIETVVVDCEGVSYWDAQGGHRRRARASTLEELEHQRDYIGLADDACEVMRLGLASPRKDLPAPPPVHDRGSVSARIIGALERMEASS